MYDLPEKSGGRSSFRPTVSVAGGGFRGEAQAGIRRDRTSVHAGASVYPFTLASLNKVSGFFESARDFLHRKRAVRKKTCGNGRPPSRHGVGSCAFTGGFDTRAGGRPDVGAGPFGEIITRLWVKSYIFTEQDI